MIYYTIEEAGELVRLVRSTIELQIRSPKFDSKILEMRLKGFNKKEGVVLRLIYAPTYTVRASTGILDGERLSHELLEASVSIASGKRNVPISLRELGELIVEISELGEPTLLSGSYITRRNAFELGRHGLILRYGARNYTLLPSYATENNLDKTQFLEALCKGAGLGKDYWRQPKVSVYRFETRSFIEESPDGKVKIPQ